MPKDGHSLAVRAKALGAKTARATGNDDLALDAAAFAKFAKELTFDDD